MVSQNIYKTGVGCTPGTQTVTPNQPTVLSKALSNQGGFFFVLFLSFQLFKIRTEDPEMPIVQKRKLEGQRGAQCPRDHSINRSDRTGTMAANPVLCSVPRPPLPLP